MRLAAVAAAVATLVTTPLAGQAPRLEIGDRLRESTAGMSWYSPRSTRLGSISDRRVYLAGLRGEGVFLRAGAFALAWAPEIPIAVVARTRGDIERCTRNDNMITFRCEYDTSAGVSVGAGLSPVGMKLYWNRGGHVRVYGSGNGGAMLFTSDVPVHNSRRANFTFEVGGGIEVVRRDGGGVSLGYKFHHLSNGGTERLNPGLDSNVLYLGFVGRTRSRAPSGATAAGE